jgi:SAM-dependent methyltransferase
VSPSDRAEPAGPRQFYEDQYREGQEYARTSKLFTLRCVPDGGGLSVLDVGCGTGDNSERIAAKGHTVRGVDISANAIERYCRRGFEGRVVDLERGLDFPAESFDLVFCSEVIEHLAAPEVLARETFRVLRGGGHLVVSTPNSAFWLYRMLGLVGFTVSELQHPKHVQFFSRRSLHRLLVGVGFDPVREFGRNMYLVLPAVPRTLEGLLARLGCEKEGRLRTNSHFWHVSAASSLWNSLLADTLIFVMRKPSPSP